MSGEESPSQIGQRARRLGIKGEAVHITTAVIVEDILELAEKDKPHCIIIDSIQTIYSTETPGIAGSVSQIRESASKLVSLAKHKGVPILLIGHITKEGSIAGPKVLEHIVDTVLYFEGDFSKEYRMLRAFKNRYGSANEIGLFEMTGRGLMEVRDKNRVFSPVRPGTPLQPLLRGAEQSFLKCSPWSPLLIFQTPEEWLTDLT